MTSKFGRPRQTALLGVLIGLCAVALVVDLAANVMFIGGVLPYFLAVVGAYFLFSSRLLALVCGCSLVFLLIGTIAKGAMPELFFANRLVVAVALTLVAVAVHFAIQNQTKAERQREEKEQTRDEERELLLHYADRAQRAADVANVGFWDWDTRTDELMFSRKLEELIGCGPDEHINHVDDWLQRADPEGGALQKRISEEFASGRHGGEFVADYHVDLPNGERRYFVTRAGPWISSEGEVLGLTGADTDVTELRTLTNELSEARNEAQAANRAKSQFLANMSHELRTPLNSIIGFSELVLSRIEAGQNDVKNGEYVEDVLMSGRLLLSLINDILDLSKIDAGELVSKPKRVVARDSIEAVVRMVKPSADRKEIELRVEVGGDVPAIFVDERHLHQMLTNLVSNAIKFSDERSAVIITATPVDENRVEILVQDQGDGIAPEHIIRVQEPFQQVEASFERGNTGTGLGLTITRRLAELNEGALLIQSELKVGTQARLTFKQAKSE